MLKNREQGKFKPPSDVLEAGDKFIIFVEIAGMQSDAFKLSLMNRKLVISGTRSLPSFEAAAYHRVEIETGEFRLEFHLQKAVDAESVVANYNDGLLCVELPYLPKKTVTVVTAHDKE